MIPDYVKAFEYHIPWKSNSVHFGDHRGTQRGLGSDYRGNVSLLDYPDARRMDLRESILDPYDQVQVKTFNQDNTTPVYAVCDVSSSMQFAGKQRKLDLAMEVAASVAYSAYEMGDVFGFIAYHNQVVERLTLPLSHQVHNSLEVIGELAVYETTLADSQGVEDVPFYLSQNRSLVFWVSDFHMPIDVIEHTLNGLSAHQVIPVVLWDEREYKQLPSFGFGNMLDPETGASRTMFFRKSLRNQFINAFEERREVLGHLFNKFDCTPLFLDHYTPEAMTNYFEKNMNL